MTEQEAGKLHYKQYDAIIKEVIVQTVEEIFTKIEGGN